jgi:hypothetical protein
MPNSFLINNTFLILYQFQNQKNETESVSYLFCLFIVNWNFPTNNTDSDYYYIAFTTFSVADKSISLVMNKNTTTGHLYDICSE